ncbi:MAG: hypothetical protein ACREMO_00140 [Gemmatimonadales bacterium]
MTSRDRRALRLGLTAVLGGWLLLRALPATVRAAWALDREVRGRAALLAETRASLRGEASLTDSAEIMKRLVVDLAPKIVSGHSPVEAQADLGGRVSLAADRNHLRLLRIDPLPDSTTAGRLRRLTARATLEGDIRGLTGFLQNIARDAAGLTPTGVSILAADPASPDGAPEVLQGKVTVEGWYLP